MTAKMHSFFEKRKWNDKRDTPAAAPPPCRLHFLMFSALHAEKAALLRRKNAFGRTTAFLAPRMPSQNKKAIPYGMTFCFGGDKRDRTADLMTASCDRFVILSVFTSNPSVPSAKSAGFCISSLDSPESTFLPLHAPVPYSAPHERTAPCGDSDRALSAPALEMPRTAATSVIFIIKGNSSSERYRF